MRDPLEDYANEDGELPEPALLRQPGETLDVYVHRIADHCRRLLGRNPEEES